MLNEFWAEGMGRTMRLPGWGSQWTNLCPWQGVGIVGRGGGGGGGSCVMCGKVSAGRGLGKEENRRQEGVTPIGWGD